MRVPLETNRRRYPDQEKLAHAVARREDLSIERMTPERLDAFRTYLASKPTVPDKKTFDKTGNGDVRGGWHKHLVASNGESFKVVGSGSLWQNTLENTMHPFDESEDVDTGEIYSREKFKDGSKQAADQRTARAVLGPEPSEG